MKLSLWAAMKEFLILSLILNFKAAPNKNLPKAKPFVLFYRARLDRFFHTVVSSQKQPRVKAQ